MRGSDGYELSDRWRESLMMKYMIRASSNRGESAESVSAAKATQV